MSTSVFASIENSMLRLTCLDPVPNTGGRLVVRVESETISGSEKWPTRLVTFNPEDLADLTPDDEPEPPALFAVRELRHQKTPPSLDLTKKDLQRLNTSPVVNDPWVVAAARVMLRCFYQDIALTAFGLAASIDCTLRGAKRIVRKLETFGVVDRRGDEVIPTDLWRLRELAKGDESQSLY